MKTQLLLISFEQHYKFSVFEAAECVHHVGNSFKNLTVKNFIKPSFYTFITHCRSFYLLSLNGKYIFTHGVAAGNKYQVDMLLLQKPLY